jgi:acetoin utilization deacetylase AcuC-like enzyme
LWEGAPVLQREATTASQLPEKQFGGLFLLALYCHQVLSQTLSQLLKEVQPELVLYNAGVDVHKDDALGLLALTDEGIYRRDHMVFATCAAAGVPVACAIGGGYEKEHENIVRRHMLLHRAARENAEVLAAVADRTRRKAAQFA